ncbi:MAG TPA: hypothetical protein VMF89_02850 [Polyangiales bacterium]|nr:hypothetical protein [Polyangiales bacterium]
MTKHPFRVIEGGAESAPEPPADLPPDLADKLIQWLFADIADYSALDAGRLVQRRLQSLCALTHGLTEGLAAGLTAVQASERGARDAVFAETLRTTRENLTREFAAPTE